MAAPNPALEALFHRHPVWRGAGVAPLAQAVPSGYPGLDRELPGGGWPAGALTEILCASHGIGELQIVLPALAALTVGRAPHRLAGAAAPALCARAARRGGAPGLPDRGARPRAARRAVGGGAGAARRDVPRPAAVAAARQLPGTAAAGSGGAGGARAALFRPPEAAGEPSPAVLRLALEPGKTARDTHPQAARPPLAASLPIPIPEDPSMLWVALHFPQLRRQALARGHAPPERGRESCARETAGSLPAMPRPGTQAYAGRRACDAWALAPGLHVDPGMRSRGPGARGGGGLGLPVHAARFARAAAGAAAGSRRQPALLRRALEIPRAAARGPEPPRLRGAHRRGARAARRALAGARQRRPAGGAAVAVLGLAPAARALLADLGIKTLGGLLRLPRDGIARRFGQDLLDAARPGLRRGRRRRASSSCRRRASRPGSSCRAGAAGGERAVCRAPPARPDGGFPRRAPGRRAGFSCSLLARGCAGHRREGRARHARPRRGALRAPAARAPRRAGAAQRRSRRSGSRPGISNPAGAKRSLFDDRPGSDEGLAAPGRAAAGAAGQRRGARPGHARGSPAGTGVPALSLQ